ncbi:hypothetical protein [Clostridium estertheticum]|uniref:hypothetical protein n=1 Tax=Clostridium estertheticum TaxID=238834 RepID=UPI00124EA006|nr:hypothetical protein [Clostridium estertheticum]MBZ9618532.1 hypothetical protein [Clostridium estertheticum subsp. laramiense]MCB2362295.1 hypothetical protein [Clostridium estertheticum]WAG76458.1 hypothetical protein LL032_24165 [Clostridium estertheticum]
MENLANIFGKISFCIAIVVIFLCINYFAKIIPFIHVTSFILIMPLYICPLSVILAIFSLTKKTNKWAMMGLALNSIMFLLEIAFIIMGSSLLR